MVVPLYVLTDTVPLMWADAFLVGFSGRARGAWCPTYLNERFRTVGRATGAGIAYHVGAAIGSFTPTIIGAMGIRAGQMRVAGSDRQFPMSATNPSARVPRQFTESCPPTNVW